jgi:hypothetical protein
MLNYIQSVLNFSAFRPEPDDSAFGWRSRFAGRKTALVYVGRSSLAFVPIDGKGGVGEGQEARGELKDLFTTIGPAIENETDHGWCQVSLDSRYVISLESNLSRKKGSEEAVKKDPRSVLHARFERGKRYAVTHNPESSTSLLLSYDEEFLKRTEVLCKEQGLRAGRLFCGAYVLLRHALGVTNYQKGSEKPLSALYIICCQGSVCILSQEKDSWVELRSRPDVYDDDLQPLFELIAPFKDRVAADTGLVLACNEPIAGLPEKLAEDFPGRTINDLTKPGLLAQLVYLN